ncbi:MAG: DnaD domain protein [Clostridia bacterium]|nr:DnaD domain protein [Clostridia bacterium]
MKIKFDFESGRAEFPAAALSRVTKASDTALRLLIILAADSEARADFDASAERLMTQLKCSRAELDMALAFWCGAGIADIVNDGDAETVCSEALTPPAEEPVEKPQKRTPKLMRAAGLPEYTSEELGDMLEQNSGSLHLVDEAQRRIGRMFNPREVSILVGLQKYLELDDEYIYVLLEHCARVGKTSMRYVETMAFGLYDDGVSDVESLEQSLREREEYATFEGKFKSLVGARGRKLSAKEKRFINRWTTEMKYGFEMVELAYEITVDTQHEYNPAYMNGILEKWYSKAIATPEAVRAEAEQYKAGKQRSLGSFDTDEFFEAALRRSYSEN